MAISYRVEWRWHYGTLLGVTGFHCLTDLPTGGTEPDVADIATAHDTHYTTAFRACTHNSIVVDALHVREEVDPTSGDVPSVAQHDINLAGTLGTSSHSLQQQLCPLISLKTNAAIRSGRGWMFMPPLLDKGLLGTDGYIDGTTVAWTNLNAFAALMDDELDYGTVIISHSRPVVYSRRRRQLGRSPWTFKVDHAVVRGLPHFLHSRER